MNPWEKDWSGWSIESPQAAPSPVSTQRPVINISSEPQQPAKLMPWEKDWSGFEQSDITSPGGMDRAVNSFQGMQVQPELQQRGADLSQMGERYGLTDPQEIIAADRRAQGIADNGFLNTMAQGASFGFSDEAKAAGQALMGNGSYNQNLAAEREGVRRYGRENPITAVVAEIGGALATAPFLPVANFARIPGLAGRVASGAATGAGYGAAYGFGTGEGGAVDRAQNAAGSAVTGGVLGGAVPAAISAVGATARGINNVAGNPVGMIRGLVNPEAEAARRVGVALARDAGGGTPAQALARGAQDVADQGYPAVLADTGGETTRAMARSAANTSPEGRQAIERVTQGRFETQNERARETVSRIMGGTTGNVDRIQALRAEARQANAPLYNRAYREGEGGIWTPDLEAIVQAPAVQKAIRGATERGRNVAVVEGVGPIRNPFVDDAAGNLTLATQADGSVALPNLRFWDVVKRNLDSEIDTARRAGDNTKVMDLQGLKTKLLGSLDAASPTYARARSSAASYFGAEDAVEAGETFVTSRMGNDEARRAIAKMKPAEKELFAEGFANGLIARIGEVRDRVNVVNQVFGSPASRERIALALGPKRAKEIEAFVRRENVMDMLRGAMGNSSTARQLQEIGLAGGAGALVSGGDLTDPRAILTAAAVYGGRRGMAKVDERVSRRVAELLATDDPVQLSRAIKAISGSPALSNALRALEGNLAKFVSQSGPDGYVIPSLTGRGRAQDDQPESPRGGNN